MRPVPSGYAEVVARNRESYGPDAATERDGFAKQPWKMSERSAFLDRLRAAEATTLLEIGSGTGQDSAWFQAAGLDVTAIDLSPAMVERTRAKGVRAYARDVLDLGFPAESFDAAYSMNALLHVPTDALSDALLSISSVLRPGGLFHLGVYGGSPEEGVADEDHHVPQRYFAFRSDEQLLSYAARHFEVLDFHVVHAADGVRYQSLTLVRPVPWPAR
ncbi:class I SAM-dependent methyltransferase [Paractinoplanes deccanensis]|uniref:class I SAM-dependent methyltransferase n=1 Tax=Paractinoplanes deccanensis TaxID=113561 RepID=UPI003617115E